jgi:hypothetical protein
LVTVAELAAADSSLAGKFWLPAANGTNEKGKE